MTQTPDRWSADYMAQNMTDTPTEVVERCCGQYNLGQLTDVNMSDLCRALAAERDALKAEVYKLKYAITGGEDAPGLLDTIHVEDVCNMLREERATQQGWTDAAVKAAVQEAQQEHYGPDDGWIKEDDEGTFHPASSANDVIWMGQRKYVAEDTQQEPVACVNSPNKGIAPKDPSLTQEIARALVEYNPETGQLIWKARGPEFYEGCEGVLSPTAKSNHFNSLWPGREAFTYSDGKGYKRGRLLGFHYQAHRLIWFMTHGWWPVAIDHINGNKSDNRIENLRECTFSENSRNTTNSRGTSRFNGVSWGSRDNRWIAQINLNGAKVRVGNFTSELDAALSIDEAIEKSGDQFAVKNFSDDDRKRILSALSIKPEAEVREECAETLEASATDWRAAAKDNYAASKADVADILDVEAAAIRKGGE